MDKFRMGAIVALLGSVFLVLGKSIFYPNSTIGTLTLFPFPKSIPLQNWRLVKNSSLSNSPHNHKFVSGEIYQYQQKQLTLYVEARYFVDTDGDINHYLETYRNGFSIAQTSIRQKPETGFYQLFVEGDRAHLSACINSQGGSTVTGVQFRANRNAYDLKAQRLLPWLLGRTNLRDFRCLWTHLSTPIESTPEEAYQTLESAWVAWYISWKPRFPNEVP
ncbi:MAG: cyanoexosortase A system-associated protein [Leptolyngbyaceae cyanobacterium SU_3_3]|nr:cyanoexosortase A system-associated protein [Leptolyngbyaceae cyanobacterium SU_3_3]NJR51649.1 cyanoexosortase A system-associated protein [Leptolyngbyaceae cyanobacterium CSU_1_3]